MSRRRTIIPSLFLVPALILLVSFVLFPVVNTIYISLLNEEGEFVGLDNYYEVFSRRDFWNPQNLVTGKPPPYGALIHNGIWILIHLPLSVFFGLLLAVLLRGVKGGSIVKSAVFLGMVIPMIIGGVLLRFVYDDSAGITNGLLRLIGLGHLARKWTAFPDTVLLSLILGSVWVWTGFSMIVYSAGLEGVSEELFEAAKIDGASRWRIFWRITVPMLRPATIVVVTMTLLWELKIFDIVWVIQRGGPGGASNVMALDMFLDAFFELPPKFGTASAIATLLTIMTFGFAAYMVNKMVKT
ncbi:ABC transporter permease subunit [Candidatus Bathyarchaeota archaeon]|nr:ABC transporter permease subunit [Candidatus Bathyarchaeota archaeon]